MAAGAGLRDDKFSLSNSHLLRAKGRDLEMVTRNSESRCDMYKVNWTIRGTHNESEPLSKAEAHNLAVKVAKSRAKAVTITRESDAEFHPHPDNKGKYYLYQIVK